MKPGFWDYIKAAFFAKPLGMFISPNLAALAGFGLLGYRFDPGFWLLGAGLELAYLVMLSSNNRFRRVIDAQFQEKRHGSQKQKNGQLLARLNLDNRNRYQFLEGRCREILDLQANSPDPVVGLETQGEALAKLLWIYLRLLAGREALDQMIRENDSLEKVSKSVDERAHDLELKLKENDLSDDLRRSLTAQLDVLRQRSISRKEGRSKLAYLDSELTRIQEQVALLREQAVLPAGQQGLSERIDGVTASLGGTTQWINEQRSIYGKMEDLVAEPPPLTPTAQVEAR